MADIAQWQPVKLPQTQPTADGAPSERGLQFVSFAFFALDPAWLRLDLSVRRDAAQELAAVIEECRSRFLVHAYTTFGVRAETDFLLWRVSPDLGDFESMATAMRRTLMGSYLRTPYSYLVTTGGAASHLAPSSQGPSRHGGPVPIRDRRCLLLCPLVRTGAWNALTDGERQEVMHDLLRLGGGEATYSVGLGDPDGVLTFEADRPDVCAAWAENLRQTRSASFARRDTPIFLGSRQEAASILARISGV